MGAADPLLPFPFTYVFVFRSKTIPPLLEGCGALRTAAGLPTRGGSADCFANSSGGLRIGVKLRTSLPATI